MAIYCFKIFFEDNEEVFREIEIRSTQNFEDFHNIILKSINFENLYEASFFISDDLWHKGKEIRLKPLINNKIESNVLQMNQFKMASLIEDPHQKFVYVNNPNFSWTLLIELMKIVPDDVKVKYPICVKSVGLAPKQLQNSNVIPVLADMDEVDDNLDIEGDEGYMNAHDEEEIAVLEGEEGEEDAQESNEDEMSDEEGDENYSETLTEED